MPRYVVLVLAVVADRLKSASSRSPQGFLVALR